MLCETVRVALSARLDHEDPGQPGSLLDDHLRTCAECRAWLARAEQVTRAVRLRSIAEVPDLTATIMAAVAADRSRDQRPQAVPARPGVEARARQRVLRLAVAVAAVAQLLLTLRSLVPGAAVAAGLHTGRELASFDAALAVGFLLAAWRPGLARAYTPIAVALVAFLAVTCGLDLANGVTTLAHETGHLAAVGQAGLLWALARTTRTPAVPQPATA